VHVPVSVAEVPRVAPPAVSDVVPEVTTDCVSLTLSLVPGSELEVSLVGCVVAALVADPLGEDVVLVVVPSVASSPNKGLSRAHPNCAAATITSRMSREAKAPIVTRNRQPRRG
jgi:hypothetical protein